jgi:hypothetical protein
MRCVLCVVVVLVGASGFAAEAPAVDFARDVQPIFKKHFYKCHD